MYAKNCKECGQKKIIYSADLAIAREALQIQMTEGLKFNDIFVHLGAFHMQMAFFKSIGKYIDSSGITNVLVDSPVLAEGSVNGFLAGKHFNRSKFNGAIRYYRQHCKHCKLLRFWSRMATKSEIWLQIFLEPFSPKISNLKVTGALVLYQL